MTEKEPPENSNLDEYIKRNQDCLKNEGGHRRHEQSFSKKSNPASYVPYRQRRRGPNSFIRIVREYYMATTERVSTGFNVHAVKRRTVDYYKSAIERISSNPGARALRSRTTEFINSAIERVSSGSDAHALESRTGAERNTVDSESNLTGKPTSAIRNAIIEELEQPVTIGQRASSVTSNTAGVTESSSTAVVQRENRSLMAGRTIQDVAVVDVRMPFWSIVVLMVKLTIASIPALIILAVILLVMGVIASVVLGVLGSLLI